MQHNGMNLRQYYAAHAPLPIPDWFRVEWDEPPPFIPAPPKDWDAVRRDEFVRLKSGDVAEFAPEQVVMAFYLEWKAANTEHIAWRDGQRERKFFMWRWHFADMMIKTGSAA